MPFSCDRIDRIGQRRNNRRQPRFAKPGGWEVGFDELHGDVARGCPSAKVLENLLHIEVEGLRFRRVNDNA